MLATQHCCCWCQKLHLHQQLLLLVVSVYGLQAAHQIGTCYWQLQALLQQQQWRPLLQRLLQPSVLSCQQAAWWVNCLLLLLLHLPSLLRHQVLHQPCTAHQDKDRSINGAALLLGELLREVADNAGEVRPWMLVSMLLDDHLTTVKVCAPGMCPTHRCPAHYLYPSAAADAAALPFLKHATTCCLFSCSL
jgi:hypothetical protein